ncbi:Ras-related protein Rab-43 [Willisornis vidua]|uniref:Ras-related protein Rab-43 n=1 Tax=Willisornis vidua TaxID=1566151 RepID=A0ABQ9DS17_9PASS|nr:Ras-related protein Rab-43 [Willisornis vidua]
MPGLAAPSPGPDPEENYDFLFKLVLIGDASVGKTCLVQRFKTGAFAERQGSTIGVDFTMKSLEIQGKRVKNGPQCDVSLSGQIARNKSDLSDLREVQLEEAQGLAEHYENIICAIETSAKDSSNVEEAFVKMATELMLRHGGPMFSEKNTDSIKLDSKDVVEGWGCGC